MCTSPIWINNPRYFRKDHDISLPASNLAQSPWDVARFRLAVPCGGCEECLRSLRNEWYVRLRQELARCRAEHCEAWFVTITIHPRYYQRALNDPTWFMRKWFERVRHVIGRSIKHAFFQEFGIHPQMGTEPRLHFHGFLFDPRMHYNEFRRIVSKFGFVWLCQATPKRARYCVKYVVKDLNTSDYEISDKLRLKLSDRRYTRKFVSAGVGDFLGTQPRPSLVTSTWSYDADRKVGGYQYRIPRYYDKYLQRHEKEQKAILSAARYALCFHGDMVRDLLAQLAERFSLDPASLCFGKGPFSRLMTYLRMTATRTQYVPATIPELFFDVVPIWKKAFGVEISPRVLVYQPNIAT